MNLSKRFNIRVKNKRFWICFPWFLLMMVCVAPFYILSIACRFIVSIFEILYLFFDDAGVFVGYKVFFARKITKWVQNGDKK